MKVIIPNHASTIATSAGKPVVAIADDTLITGRQRVWETTCIFNSKGVQSTHTQATVGSFVCLIIMQSCDAFTSIVDNAANYLAPMWA